jgi:hypothetical protein
MCADNAASTYLYYNVSNVEDYGFRESSMIEAEVLPLPLNLTQQLLVIGEFVWARRRPPTVGEGVGGRW